MSELTCFLSIIDDITPEGRLGAQVTKIVPANRPTAFEIRGLSSGQFYRVCFGGLDRIAAEMCVGSFRTFDVHRPNFRVISLSMDKVTAPPYSSAHHRITAV